MKQAPLRALRCLPRLSTGISSGVWLMQSALPRGGALNKTTRVPFGPARSRIARDPGARGAARIRLGSDAMARRSLSPRFGWLFSMAALLLTLVGLLWPAVAAYVPVSASTAPDPVRITDYRARFGVASDGDLAAVEQITAEFPFGRHGIFRFWDLADPSDSHARLVPEDIQVTYDDQPVPVDLSWQRERRYRVAKIGDPDSFVPPGQHVYTISYRIEGAIAPASAGPDVGSSSWTGSGGGSAFYWNVIPGGWQMDIDNSVITVQLPSEPGQVLCLAGVNTSYPCAVRRDGSTLRLATGALPPRTPVTVRAALAGDPPDRVTLPWPIQFDMVLGRSVPLAVVLAL